MPNRKTPAATPSTYRYGFNGKENDDEVYGDDNEQDYGMRIYDPRLGRFLSVDPIAREYPELTPYQFASNTPLQAVDLDGLEAAGVGPGLGMDQLQSQKANEITGEGMIAAGKGVGESLYNSVVGLYQAVTNPVKTIKNVANLVSNPSIIKQGIEKYGDNLMSEDPKTAGNAVGHGIGFLFEGAVTGKIFSGLKPSLIKGTLGSYFNSVSGGVGLSPKWQAYRYFATMRYTILRPSKQLPSSLGDIRLRHYTDETTLLKIQNSLTLIPGRRGLVFNIIGGDDIAWGAKEAEQFLGVAPGRTSHYLEYTIDASRVFYSYHPWTNLLEYNVKGKIDLTKANPEFFLNK